MSKIRIFNPKSNHELVIDTTVSWVFFHPRAYEDKPCFEIKLINGFNLSRHALTCEDCGAFVKSFGKETLDWYLEYNKNTFRLSLEKLGTDTKLKFINSNGGVIAPINKTNMEYVLFAVKIGEKNYMETIITETKDKDRLEMAKSWALLNGFDRLRVLKINPEKLEFPSFTQSINI